MSLGSAALLCKEHFPFFHTIMVESQTKLKNDTSKTEKIPHFSPSFNFTFGNCQLFQILFVKP